MTYRLSRAMPSESRQHETEQIKQKYFFVVEGEATEVIYFEALNNHERRNSLTEILILDRIDGSKSHQLKITEAIKAYLDIIKQLTQKDKQILLDVLYALEEEEIAEPQALVQLEDILGASMQVIIDEDGSVKEQLKTFQMLNEYDVDYDNICIIMDRDMQSFKPEQFDKVLQICDANKFLLGVTNPNFEFYLLLHLTDALHLDGEEIKQNQRVSRNVKFVEHELKQEMLQKELSYRKNNYDANFFVKLLDEYHINIKQYESDNNRLKERIGSSVHKIMQELL